MTGGEMVKPHDDVQCHVHHTLFTSSLKALAFLLPPPTFAFGKIVLSGLKIGAEHSNSVKLNDLDLLCFHRAG